MQASCRLSFIVTTRNDGFGRGMLRRLGVFVDGLLELAERHRLDGELIIVEWNPPDGRRLHEVLELRNSSEHLAIRFIEVPHAVHTRIPNSDRIPLFQMMAKNVGIRRAQGQYLVATNQDILFSDALIRLLADGPLDDRAMYRIDRHDVPADPPVGIPIDDQLAWCERNLLRVHRSYGSFEHRRGVMRSVPVLRWKPPIPLVGTGKRAVGFVRRLFMSTMQAMGVRMSLDNGHTNGCGDFTLLSRERWHSLRGYAEFPLFSMHLDSLLCWQAIAAGAKQRILRRPCRIYHIEHRHSWVAMDWQEKLNTFAHKPWLDLGMLREVRREILRKHNTTPINGPDWGLGDLSLRQVEVRGGEKRLLPTELPLERDQASVSIGG